MSNTRLRRKADSKARNKKRLRNNAIKNAMAEQQDLAEIIDDVGGMLATAHNYTEILGAAIQVYQPHMTEEENTACTVPWRTLVNDLVKLATSHNALKTEFGAYKPVIGADDFTSMSTDTLQGLNLYNQTEEITNLYSMGIAPLLLDCYSQVQYVADKYGKDKMDTVNEHLQKSFDDAKVALVTNTENK